MNYRIHRVAAAAALAATAVAAADTGHTVSIAQAALIKPVAVGQPGLSFS